jgi:DNA-binding IclR family transcriptional regulator
MLPPQNAMNIPAPGKTWAARLVDPAASKDGTQAIRRAASILKAIASAVPNGVSLAEVSRTGNLPRSTAHRILKCLMEEGFVDHAEGGRRYQMGALVYELGLAVSRSAMEVARWRNVIDRVARRTGVTSYLMRRTGMEAVCLVKAEGHSVLRVIPVEVGQRRFLGVGAGATALLAAFDEETADHFIDVIVPELKNYPRITDPYLRQAVRAARKTGVAISQGKVMDQTFGIGVLIPDATATPSLAISIAAHLPTVTDSNIGQWTQVIKEEIENAAHLQKGALT